jgi:nicotinamide-nucleotide amidase
VNVEIVTIGDELLLGFTIDTNAAHIARALADIGVAITRRATVGDQEAEISAAVSEALARADGVITTGGLGPTSDDRSRHAIAALFGREVVFHQPTYDALVERWKKLGVGELPATNRNQAMLPAGATLLANRHGSAPGIWLENDRKKWVAMMPGVPREMRGMLAEEVAPRIAALVGPHPHVVASRTLRTTGVAESRLADTIGNIALPDGVDLAYLPGWEGVDLRITIRSAGADAARMALAAARDALRAPISDVVYGEDGADLADVVLRLLRDRKWKIAVGESCTGGMLGMRLTAIPGSSDVVVGGIIAYDNRVKTSHLGVHEETIRTHGAVSDEVARQMASGARAATGAHVGVGITGVAGPDGGTEAKPVGTVAIAVDIEGSVDGRVSRFIGDRDEVRRRATQAALNMVRMRTFGARPSYITPL